MKLCAILCEPLCYSYYIELHKPVRRDPLAGEEGTEKAQSDNDNTNYISSKSDLDQLPTSKVEINIHLPKYCNYERRIHFIPMEI